MSSRAARPSARNTVKGGGSSASCRELSGIAAADPSARRGWLPAALEQIARIPYNDANCDASPATRTPARAPCRGQEEAMSEGHSHPDWRDHGVRVVSAKDLDTNTPPTPGMS